MRDEFTGETYQWGKTFYARLEPGLSLPTLPFWYQAIPTPSKVEYRGGGPDLPRAAPHFSTMADGSDATGSKARTDSAN